MTQFPERTLRVPASLPSLRAVIRSAFEMMKKRRGSPPPPPVAQSPPAPESDFKLELERRLLGQ